MKTEQDALQGKRELLRVDVVPKVPFGNAGSDDARDRLTQVDLVANELVAHGAGLVVEFHRCHHEQATAG